MVRRDSAWPRTRCGLRTGSRDAVSAQCRSSSTTVSGPAAVSVSLICASAAPRPTNAAPGAAADTSSVSPSLRTGIQCRGSVAALMRRPGPDATLAGIYISVHTQPNTHPVKTEWVDEALAGANAAGTPLGALIGRPLALGDGIMLVGWPEGG